MALVSQGTYLEVGDGSSPPVYSEIGEVNSIDWSGGGRDEIDTTHLRSVAKEFQLALRDTGQVTLGCNLKPSDAAQRTLKTLFETDPPPSRSYRLTMAIDSDGGHTTASTIVFDARVQSYGFTFSVDEKATLQITLRSTDADTTSWGT